MHLGGGPVRNTLFGNLHNKKPYDGKNVQASLGYEFTAYPQPLIGTVLLFKQTMFFGSVIVCCNVSFAVKFNANLKAHLIVMTWVIYRGYNGITRYAI